VNDTTSVGRIFSGRLSYRKGAMVLHMMRYKIGDTDFFQSVKNYLADPNLAYGYAKTIDLQNHFETVTGENLTEFFNDWFRGEGYPSFQVDWNYDNVDNNVHFTVNQTQSHNSVSFFETPLPIKVIGTGGQELLLRLELTQNGQQFIESVPFEVVNIEIDPTVQLISRNNSSTLNTDDVISLDNAIKIFPNPVNDVLTISNESSFQILTLSLFNMLGQQVAVFDNPLSEINLKDLSVGVYSIKIEIDAKVLYKTIIKE
jgi:hypothetical protein